MSLVLFDLAPVRRLFLVERWRLQRHQLVESDQKGNHHCEEDDDSGEDAGTEELVDVCVRAQGRHSLINYYFYLFDYMTDPFYSLCCMPCQNQVHVDKHETQADQTK